MEKQIETTVKRGRAYWFTDGFTEMIGGIFALLVGGIVLLYGMAWQNAFLARFASTAFDLAAVKLVAFLAAVLVLWWLKDRFTYPRTGYVRGKRVPSSVILTFIRNVLLVVVLPVLALLAVFVFFPPVRSILAFLPGGLPIGIGILWGILCYVAGEWMGLRRFRLMGWLILLAGVVIGVWQIQAGFPSLAPEALQANWLAPMPEALRAPLDEILSRLFVGVGGLSLATGFLFLFSGFVTFLRYRKENPVPYREES